jgi:hypothetical protein
VLCREVVREKPHYDNEPMATTWMCCKKKKIKSSPNSVKRTRKPTSSIYFIIYTKRIAVKYNRLSPDAVILMRIYNILLVLPEQMHCLRFERSVSHRGLKPSEMFGEEKEKSENLDWTRDNISTDDWGATARENYSDYSYNKQNDFDAIENTCLSYLYLFFSHRPSVWNYIFNKNINSNIIYSKLRPSTSRNRTYSAFPSSTVLRVHDLRHTATVNTIKRKTLIRIAPRV